MLKLDTGERSGTVEVCISHEREWYADISRRGWNVIPMIQTDLLEETKRDSIVLSGSNNVSRCPARLRNYLDQAPMRLSISLHAKKRLRVSLSFTGLAISHPYLCILVSGGLDLTSLIDRRLYKPSYEYTRQVHKAKSGHLNLRAQQIHCSPSSRTSPIFDLTACFVKSQCPIVCLQEATVYSP